MNEPTIVHVHHIKLEAPAVATLTRQRDDLAAYCERLEAENTRLRRKVARLESEAVRAPRKAPIWLLPFAYVGIAWGAYNGTYSYEPTEEEPS